MSDVTEFVAYVERKWGGGTGHTASNRWVSHAELRKYAEMFNEERAGEKPIVVTLHEPEPEVPRRGPCPVTRGPHQWAWLTAGGQACGYCGKPR